MPDTGPVGSGPVDPGDVGSLGEEAARLLRALATEAGRREPSGPDGSDDDARTAEHVCTTGWCPVCQVVGFVKEHPEVVEQLTDSAILMARSIRDVLEHALPPSGDVDRT